MADELDLAPALRRMHEWALTEGDLGYSYWHGVSRLLESAAHLQAKNVELEARLGSIVRERRGKRAGGRAMKR